MEQELIPRRIFALWLQGEDRAPPVVKMCLHRWRRLNPDYEIRVLDRNDADHVLQDFSLSCRQLAPEALSDVLRVNLLRSHGGVWVDATAFPIRPLSAWLPDAARSGFFAFQGHRPPIDADSWFLAAAPGHIIPSLWWEEIERYWYKPRTEIPLQNDAFTLNYNFDPLSFFCSEDAMKLDSYPYYWVMYLFTHLLQSRSEFRLAWDKVEKKSGADCTAIQRLSSERPNVSDRDLIEACIHTDVQKLSHKATQARRWLSLDRAFSEMGNSFGSALEPEAFESTYQRVYEFQTKVKFKAVSAARRVARSILGRERYNAVKRTFIGK